MKGRAAAVLAGVLLLAGCARTLGTEDYATDQPTGHAAGTAVHLDGPPPLTLHRPEGDVDLDAWTYCYSSPDSGEAGCADGGPAADLPTTAAVGEVAFSYPLRGWAFRAEFVQTGDNGRCRTVRSTALTQGEAATCAVPALGPAGSWDVMVTGYGDTGNDLATSFRWKTASDSSRPTPATGVAQFIGPPMSREDEPVAFGPSLYLAGLPDEPASAHAELVLPDAPGGRHTRWSCGRTAATATAPCTSRPPASRGPRSTFRSSGSRPTPPRYA